MAGGGITVDVCSSMGRRCLAYDLVPSRPDIQAHDIREGFPQEATGCDLIFCDPPYHTMLARHYVDDAISRAPLAEWILFLQNMAKQAFKVLQPGGYLTLRYQLPKPRKTSLEDLAISIMRFWLFRLVFALVFFLSDELVVRWKEPICHSMFDKHARDGHLLGQVRNLLVLRKPLQPAETNFTILFLQDPSQHRFFLAH